MVDLVIVLCCILYEVPQLRSVPEQSIRLLPLSTMSPGKDTV